MDDASIRNFTEIILFFCDSVPLLDAASFDEIRLKAMWCVRDLLSSIFFFGSVAAATDETRNSISVLFLLFLKSFE